MSNQSEERSGKSRNVTRRNFLKTSLAGGFGLGLLSPFTSANGTPDGRTGSLQDADFSFVHLTDMHVQRKRQGHKGYRACINAVNAISPTPDFALMGGDLAFDGLYTPKEEFEDQIQLYKEISKGLQMPHYHCIGNHDLLGWSSRRKVSVDDPELGKVMILDRLGMKNSYYSFDRNGWHFVMLDSLHKTENEHGPGYEPQIGKKQREWLRHDLGKAHPKPTVIVSHYPMFDHMGQINGDEEMKAMNHLVIQDTKEVRHILERHNVRAVLQGHVHMTEDFYYKGIWYLTSQSVSAAWWGGNWLGFKPGFTLLKVKGDDLSWERLTYDWEHQLEPQDTLERKRIKELEQFREEQDSLFREETKSGSEMEKE